MIKKSILRKLNLLFYIIRKEQTSLVELAKHLDVPKRTVKEDLKTINELMADEFSLSNFLLSSRQGVITIHPDYQQDAVKNAYALKLSLLKNQMIFNFCVLLITNVSISKDELLDNLFISDVYLSKLTSQLNEFLKRYRLKIGIRNEHYSLEGDEFELRLFSCILLQDSHQNLEWPFKNVSKEQIRRNIPESILKNSYMISNTKRHSLYLFHQLLRLRFDHQKFLRTKLKPTIEEIIDLMVFQYDGAFVIHAGGYGEIPDEYYRQEVLYFNFVLHILTPDSVSCQTKIEIGRLFAQSDAEICQFSRKVFQAFTPVSAFPISESSIFLILYYLVLLNTLYELIGERMEYYLDLYLPKSTFYLSTTNNYIEDIRQAMEQVISDPRHAAYTSSMLYSLSISEKQTQIQLYIQMNKDFIATYALQNRLQGFFNSDNIFITNDYSKADIVVTDSLEVSDSEDKLIFYFDSLSNEDAWEHLLILIRKLYLKKSAVISS